MAYPVLAVLMLISAPSDIPDNDLATVKRTISQWNLAMGRASNVAVLPVSWSEHAVAEFGERPQAILNEQLVDDADMALALFADRLGTPTGEAESGTLEEIERMVEAGKPVCVLVNRGPRSLSGAAAAAEKQRLEDAIQSLYQRAIVLQYKDQAELVGHLNNMLSRATGRIEGSGALTGYQPKATDSIGVWPSVVHIERQETDNQGRLRTKTDQYLVLRNETGRPVQDVAFRIPEDAGLEVINDYEIIERMAPGQEVRFPILASYGGDAKAQCTVIWRFVDGEPQESTATITV